MAQQVIYDPYQGWMFEPIEVVYQRPPAVTDPKSMAVKSETPEDRERLWQAVIDSARGT